MSEIKRLQAGVEKALRYGGLVKITVHNIDQVVQARCYAQRAAPIIGGDPNRLMFVTVRPELRNCMPPGAILA